MGAAAPSFPSKRLRISPGWCPKCQGAAAKEWLAARQAEQLDVKYYHLVFTLPAPISDIAYQNKAVIYAILLKTAAETVITIAADARTGIGHPGVRVGVTSALHTWGSASCRRRACSATTQQPHVHMIVPAAGYLKMASSGSAGGPASSCPCVCTCGCSDGCSWRSWPRP